MLREVSKKRTKADEYIKTMKNQHASGAFYKKGRNTVQNTAEILLYFCTEAEKPDLFVWQLRKAAAYLLSSQQKSNKAVIPELVLDALEAWHKKFHSNNDEIS